MRGSAPRPPEFKTNLTALPLIGSTRFGLSLIATMGLHLSLERTYFIQNALVGPSKKIKDNQPADTRDERQQSEPSGTPLAPRKPEHN